MGYRSSNAEKLMLKERGYIYSTKHEGWYSVSDEAFYPESAVQLARDPFTGRVFTVGFKHLRARKLAQPFIGIDRDWEGSRMGFREQLPFPAVGVQGSPAGLLREKSQVDPSFQPDE